MYDVHGKTYGSQRFFEAAHALGVSLIVLDKRDHWLASETYTHLREEFIAIDLSARANLPSRISAALRGRAVDGIVTFTDKYVVATAEASEILGLHTEPVRIMRQTHHKHEMRQLPLSLLNDDDIKKKVQTFCLHSTSKLGLLFPRARQTTRRTAVPTHRQALPGRGLPRGDEGLRRDQPPRSGRDVRARYPACRAWYHSGNVRSGAGAGCKLRPPGRGGALP